MKRTNYSTTQVLFAIGLVILGFTACKDESTVDPTTRHAAKEYNADVPLQWNRLFLEIDRYAPGYRPPAAARMLAYTGLAVYESVVPGMPEYNSMKHEFGLTLPIAETGKEYHWPACASAAYATMFRNFYPHISQEYKNKIDLLESELNASFAAIVPEDVLDRSRAFGTSIANIIYAYSTSDQAGHEAYLNPRPSGYIPPTVGPNGEKLWQPTFPDYTPALFPYWGNVRPFAMSQADLIAEPPLPYSEDPGSLFYQQANEVRLWVNQATYEDKWIAEFWSDDIFQLTFEPAGRQVAIANILIEETDLTLDRAVELNAQLGMAMCDAAIAIWNSKYIYNVRRPVEYIREIMDPNWKTLLNNPINGVTGMTPEFPAYPSGHSGFGGAGSAIFAEIFGNVHPYTDNCHLGRNEFIGTPRTYNTLLEAGVENAYSRLPLGVHYRMDCDEGLRLGYLAATRVSQLPWRS